MKKINSIYNKQEMTTLNKPKLETRKELKENKEAKEKKTQKRKSQNKQNKRIYIS